MARQRPHVHRRDRTKQASIGHKTLTIRSGGAGPAALCKAAALVALEGPKRRPHVLVASTHIDPYRHAHGGTGR